MKHILMDKKGDKILSIYWFAILFIVAAAIVYMVISFYGKPYDIRSAEANALTNKIADCFSTGGYINQEVLKMNPDNLLKTCGLNFNTEDAHGWAQEGQYYINVSVGDFNSGKIFFQSEQGNVNLKDACSQTGPSVPVCLQREFYSVNKDNPQTQYKIDITSVVRKTEKNVQ